MRKVIFDNDQLYAAIDFSIITPIFHLEIRQENCPLSLYKYIKNTLLEDALVTLGVLGFDMVLSIVPEGDEKLLKFQKKMGFEEEKRVDGMVILAQDIM